MGHSDADVDFVVYSRFSFDHPDIPSGEPVFIELPRDFNSDGVQHDVVLK